MPIALAQSSASEISQLQALIAQLTSQLDVLQGTSAPSGSTAGIPAGYKFTDNLTVGSTGSAVMYMQMFLNADPSTRVASSGAGSPGKESQYFGSLTKAAVAKFQDKYASDILGPVGLTKGTGYFGASTRAKVNALLGGAPATSVSVPTAPGSPVIPSAAGLSFALAADNVPSSNIPIGAAEAPYMKFAVYGNGTLNSLTFKRVGLGATADFASSGVKVYEGSNRLTTGKSLNSTSHEVDFTNLNLVVNGSRTFTLAADMSATATGGNINAFNLIKVNGNELAVPLKGNQMVIAGATVGSVTVAKQSSLSNPTVGQVGAKLSEFKVTAGATEDLWVKRVVLTQAGSINSANVTNVKMMQAGQTVASVAGHVGRDLYVLELANPFKILKGQNRTFEVYGDIGPLAKKDETIKFYLDVTNDFYATGATYGYGVTVTSTAFDSDPSDHHVLTLRGAEVTVTFNGPATRDIPAKAQDVTLFDFTIAAKNNVEIRKLVFNNDVTNIGTGEGFNDWKIVDASTGAAVSSASDITADGNTSVTDFINISAGTSRRFLVTADVDPDNDASDSIKVTFNQIGASDIKNLDNNQFVAQADIVPNADIVGNTQTVKAVSLDVTLSGTPASHNVVKGTLNESLFGFNLKAVNGPVKITSLKLTASSAAGDAGTDAQLINDLRTIGIFIGDQSLATKQNFATASSLNTATFSNIEYTIPEGATVKVVVKADSIATDATATNAYFVSLADLSTDLTAVDIEGNTLSLTGAVNDTAAVKVTVTAPTIRVDAVTDQDTEAGLVAANGERLLARYDFFAANAAVQVTKIKIGVATSGTTTTTALNEEVKEIRVYDGNTLLMSGVPAGSGADAGAVKFENRNGLFTAPGDTTKQLEVRALMADVTGVTGGANTGTSLNAYISTANFEGVAGTTQLTTLTGAGAANVKRLYKTIPTVTVSSPSSSVLTAGEVEALKFTIAADTNGDVEWSQIEFTASLSSATLTANTITLRYSGTDLSLATKTVAATGGEGVIALTTPERISAGQSKTYSLLLDVSAVGSTSASLVTKLKRDETGYDAAAGRVAQENDGDSFVWSDRGVLPHSATSADWHNGFNVKTLPSGSKALVKSS